MPMRTRPSAASDSIVTRSAGSTRTISWESRAGRTTAPGSSTSQSSGTRSDSSRSVAASSAGRSGSSAPIRTPDAAWIDARVDAALAAVPSRSTRWSFAQVIRIF